MVIKKALIIFFAFAILNTTVYCQEKSKINSVSILFIGNSLTYTNNLPKLVEKQAKFQGIKVKTKMVAYPNFAIEDHWKNGNVQNLITSKKYDYVIIQQGPSSQQNGREMLIEYGKKYSNLCQLNNAKLCYFMVWPSLSYYHTFDDVIKNYTDAAAINNTILLPVGQVWKTYFDSTNNFNYYGSDGFHPSLLGSEVAAKVIVEYLFSEN